MSKEIAEEYASSLADLTVNSKPLVNMLTMLAEENREHAGIIVETVEKHLQKVRADLKLPVLYLIDSIIKNVRGLYIQKFAEIIVNLFTHTFKRVDEKVRARMLKLRETWIDVFPATKLYQLDMKVKLIDPAWPKQARPQEPNIQVNLNFLKKPVLTSTDLPKDENQLRCIIAEKEHELLIIQQKEIQLKLEQTRRHLELAKKNVYMSMLTTSTYLPKDEIQLRRVIAEKEQELLIIQEKEIQLELEKTRRRLELAKKNIYTMRKTVPAVIPTTNRVALVSPVVAPLMQPASKAVPVKQSLITSVNKSVSAPCIAPVSGVLAATRRDPRLAAARRDPRLAAARRDPRLARRGAPPAKLAPPPLLPPVTAPALLPPPHKVPNLFVRHQAIKPLPECVTNRKNVITIDVCPDSHLLDPRQECYRNNCRSNGNKSPPFDGYKSELHIADTKKVNKLTPFLKINRDEPKEKEAPVNKKRKYATSLTEMRALVNSPLKSFI